MSNVLFFLKIKYFIIVAIVLSYLISCHVIWKKKKRVSWFQNLPFSKSKQFYLIWSMPFSTIAAQKRNLNLGRISPWYLAPFIIYIEPLLKTPSWTSKVQNMEVTEDAVQRFSVCCVNTINVKKERFTEVNMIWCYF